MRMTMAAVRGGAIPGRQSILHGGNARPSIWQGGFLGQEADGDHHETKDQGHQPKALFPDASAMKDDLRRQMAKPEYDVAIYYHKMGIWQFIARHPWFEKMTLFVIAMNAVWIAIDTDHNDSSVLLQAGPIFQMAEHVFCIYFSFEWTIRFMAFNKKMDGRKDFWFVFDSCLVLMMVLETWVMTAIMVILDFPGGNLGNASILRMARLLRLTRMARMARLLRAMPELLILIKGMAAAMRSVCFTLGLLSVIIYVFGICFTQLCQDEPCGREFKSVGHSMHYLLVNGALMDGIGDVRKLLEIEQGSYVLLLIFYIFVLLAALTVMNMLIGVICEVVSAVATTEQERMTVSYVKEKIYQLIQKQNKDDDDAISRHEFREMFENKDAMTILQDVGVDVIGLVDFADTIFDDACEANEDGTEGKLSFEDFMGLILDLRGSNNATVKDVVDLRKHINARIEGFENKLLELPHFAMARKSNRAHGTNASTNSVHSKGNACHQDPQKALRQLVDQSLQDYTSLHHKEMMDLKEQTRRLRAALVNHGGDIVTATGSLYKPDDESMKLQNGFFGSGDIPKTNKLQDMSMEERVNRLSSKPPLQEAIAEMTYHKGCDVLETSSPRLGKIMDETKNGADGTTHNSHMAKTDEKITLAEEARSPSTFATSSNPLRQDHSPKQGKLLATHTM